MFQRAKLSTRSINHLCWCNWRTFWRKNAAGRSPRGSCSCTTMSRLTGHLEPNINWFTWTSIALITHPLLRMWPHRTTTYSLDWKKKAIERSPFFVWRGHLCRGDLVRRTTFWIFLNGSQKLEQRAKKCIEFRGEHVFWINPEFGRCSLFPSWSG